MAQKPRYYLYVEKQYIQVLHSSQTHMPLEFHPTSKSSRKRTQPVVRKYTRIRLSRDARAAISARQKEALRRFQEGIQTTWRDIDKNAETLAATHHKSVKYVQNQLYMGRQMVRAKRKKRSTWNAFIWKKGEERRNDAESKSTFLWMLFLAYIGIPRCISVTRQAIPSTYCQESYHGVQQPYETRESQYTQRVRRV